MPKKSCESNESISYQAFAINYAQYQEFLKLIKEIERQQLLIFKQRIDAHDLNVEYKKLQFSERFIRKMKNKIMCYVPIKEKDGFVTLSYQKIEEYEKELENSVLSTNMTNQATNLHISNTCRTTARSILNHVLDYNPYVPSFFMMEFAYQTKLRGRLLDKSRMFYILPPPPITVHNPYKKKVLQALYERLENIPKYEPEAKETKEKFNALKNLYQNLAGPSNLSIGMLLVDIEQYFENNKNLFIQHRRRGFFSSLFQVVDPKTATEKTFDGLKSYLSNALG